MIYVGKYISPNTDTLRGIDMTTTAASHTYLVSTQLIHQMDDLGKLMDSPNYMGGEAHNLTLDQRVEVLLDKGDTVVTFPVGSALTRTKDGTCILQHPSVGRITFKWGDHPGEGTFEPPGR